ncbi:MAG: hypothetical protein RLY86_2701 [Pseudomonadota bacterium]|jgi:DNA-binding NarL/FixJ family response regulator
MRLLLADTDAAFRGRLRPLLKRVSGLRHCDEFDDFDALAADKPSSGEATILILSESLAGLPRGGVAQLAQAQPDRPVVVIGPDEPERLRAVFREGARGFVRRTQVVDELPQAIATVMDGGIYIPPLLGMRPSAEPLMTQAGPIPVGFFREDGAQQLTPRQREVLSMIRSDWDNKEIADALGVTIGTVKIHITAIFKALGVRNRTQARVAAECLNVPMMKRPVGQT